MKKLNCKAIAFVCLIVAFPIKANGQVKSSSADGFLIEISLELDLGTKEAYAAFVDDFSKWYDASHSYTSKAENLSLDLDKHCMLEKLPEGGFVRHMEIVFHQPGQVLRMTGGLGPLQGMGVAGAMTFTFSGKDGKTNLEMIYSVSGAQHLHLDKVAEPVNQVLKSQLDRFQTYCRSLENKSGEAQVLFEVPIKLTDANNISVNAILNGVDELELMFHTANSGVVVTNAAAKRLSTLKFDNSANMNSWGGQFQGRFSENQVVQIGELRRDKIRVFEDQLSGPGTDGKFGPDFFEGKVLELDFDARKLRVHSGLPASASGFEKLDITREDGMMFLKGQVTIGNEQHEKRFLIHSGFGGAILLDNEFVETHDLASQLPTLSESELHDSGGNVLKTRKVELPVLKIGGFQFTDTPSQIFEGSIRQQKMSIVGGDILKRFNIIFDPKGSCIYLKKNRLFESDFAE